MTKNCIKVTSETQKVIFISSIPYKISQNFDKMLILLTKGYFLEGLLFIYLL